MVGAGRFGCGGDADGGPGGVTDVGGGVDGRDGDGDGISRWEDNVAQVTLGTEPNAPLAYDPGLEHHHPIMSTLREPGGVTDVGGGVDGRDGDGDGISRWEDNVAQVTLGTEPNAPLAYDPGLEHHHPIMSTLREPGGQLEIERERYLKR